MLGDRLQYVIVKGHEEGLEAIEFLKQQASGRGSFIPLQLRQRQREPLPLGEAEVIAPLLDMVSIKDGYREIAEYLLSDVIVVQNLDRRLGAMEPQRLLLHHGHPGRRSDRFHRHRDRRQQRAAGRQFARPSAGAFANSRSALADCAARLPDAESEFDKIKA